MDLNRTCLICNNQYSNPVEEDESGLGEEKGWSLFCLLWKLLGISLEGEGGRSLKRVRVNLLKGQPWCGDCHAVLDDLRRLHEEIEKAKRRKETMLEGVKFLVSDNLNKSEHLDGAWAAHRLQLVKYCTGAADGIVEENYEDHLMSFGEGDTTPPPNSPFQVEEKVDVRDCRIVLQHCSARTDGIAEEDEDQSMSSSEGEEEKKRDKRQLELKTTERIPSRAKNFTCGICNKIIPHRNTARHQRSHSSKGTFPCPVKGCRYKSNRKDTLKRHMKSKHKTYVRRSSPRKTSKPNPSEADSSETEMAGIQSAEGRVEEAETGQGGSGDNQPIYKCRKCNQKFSDKSSRLAHYEDAHKNDLFQCDVCGQGFNWKDNLQRHILQAHLNHPPPVRKGKDPTAPVPPPTSWICEQCGLKFSDKGVLSRHALTHSDLRPFKCDFCDKAFKRKDMVLGHKKKVHKEQLEKSLVGSVDLN